MLAVAALAVALPTATTSGAGAFVGPYLAARAIVVTLYLRAGRHVVVGRRIALNLTVASAVAACG